MDSSIAYYLPTAPALPTQKGWHARLSIQGWCHSCMCTKHTHSVAINRLQHRPYFQSLINNTTVCIISAGGH